MRVSPKTIRLKSVGRKIRLKNSLDSKRRIHRSAVGLTRRGATRSLETTSLDVGDERESEGNSLSLNFHN
jgi:hypothetical protein